MPQTNHQRHRAALRKACNHDAVGRYAARLFIRDQGFDFGLRLAHARLVLAVDNIRTHDVVPSWHFVTTIDRHRHNRRVGEQIPHIAHARQIHLLSYRNKITPVCTQTVQDDDGGSGASVGVAGLGF